MIRFSKFQQSQSQEDTAEVLPPSCCSAFMSSVCVRESEWVKYRSRQIVREGAAHVLSHVDHRRWFCIFDSERQFRLNWWRQEVRMRVSGGSKLQYDTVSNVQSLQQISWPRGLLVSSKTHHWGWSHDHLSHLRSVLFTKITYFSSQH